MGPAGLRIREIRPEPASDTSLAGLGRQIPRFIDAEEYRDEDWQQTWMSSIIGLTCCWCRWCRVVHRPEDSSHHCSEASCILAHGGLYRGGQNL